HCRAGSRVDGHREATTQCERYSGLIQSQHHGAEVFEKIRHRKGPGSPGHSRGKLALRISNVFLPPGSWAVTVSPTFLPMSVRARGASTEMSPFVGSFSSEPTIW